MPHVAALFDAPAPALAALRGLARAGFHPGDVAYAAARPDADAGRLAAGRVVPADRAVEPWDEEGAPQGAASEDDAPRPAALDPAALADALEDRGLAPADAATFAEGVARHGAHLVVVHCPTLSAGLAAAALEAALPPDPAVHRARWAAAAASAG